MKDRILSSIVIVAVIAILFVLKATVSPLFFDFFFAIIAGFGVYEMCNMYTRRAKSTYKWLSICYVPLALAINVVSCSLIGQAGSVWLLAIIIVLDVVLAVIMAFIGYLFSIIRKTKTQEEIKIRKTSQTIAKFSFEKAKNSFFAMLYPAFLLLLFIFINHVDELPFAKQEIIDGNFSLFLLLTAILIPMFTDTFAMLSGMAFGRKKLCPRLSPNKTVAGVFGGVLYSSLLLTAIYLIFANIPNYGQLYEVFPIWAFIIVVAVGSCISILGDLYESYLKRKAEVKDSGHFIAGHGGFLDRSDSYIFIAPYMLLVMIFLLI